MSTRAELAPRALAAVPARAPAPDSRWLRLRPPSLARALTVLALALHAIVFGFSAPLGRSIAGGGLMMLRRLRVDGVGVVVLPPRRDAAAAHRAADDAGRSTGRYRFGRNPMYLGMAVMMLGLGLAAGVPFMAIAAANFVVIVAAVHIPHEEAQLQRAFGGWYSDYAASVRRWICNLNRCRGCC